MGRQPHLGMALEVGQDPGCVTHGHIQTRPEGNFERELRNGECAGEVGVGVCTRVCTCCSWGERRGEVENLHPCPGPQCACTNAANHL